LMHTYANSNKKMYERWRHENEAVELDTG